MILIRFTPMLLLLLSTATHADTNQCDTEQCANVNSLIVTKMAVTQKTEANETAEITMEDQEAVDGEVFWHRRRTSPPPPPPPPPSLDSDLSRIMEAVYALQDVAGWTKLVGITQQNADYPSTEDQFGIYRKNDGSKKCALAIAGTNEVDDIKDDLNVAVPVEKCGFNVMPGFKNEVEDFLDSSEYTNDFVPFLGSLEECNEVYVVGHSLGGAVASLIAGCAANDPDSYWPLTGLYTIGAPGVSINGQISGPSGSCLPGKRFYNVDEYTYDPVPVIGRWREYVGGAALQHPKVAAVQLYEEGWLTVTRSKVEYECSSEHAKIEPNFPMAISSPGPNPGDHSGSVYTSRLQELYPR
jgi:hypothetical protein